MKVFLNVRINFIDGERTFTVWPRANRFLPGIEFHTGISDSLADAVHQLMESLPEVFPIDDEYSVYSKSLDFAVVRPFDMVRSQTAITILGHYFRDDTEKPSISAGHSSIFTSIRI